MAKPDEKPESVTLTRAELDAMLANAASQSATVAANAVVAALKAAAPQPIGPSAEVMREIERLERERPALAEKLKPRNIPHRTRQGTTMTLRVVDSRDPELPHGRIVGLDDYQFPPGYERVKEDGGCAPVARMLKNGRENPLWQRWVWNMRKNDINNLNGQPFEPHMDNMRTAAAAE